MPIKFSHFGEILIAEIANRERQAVIQALELMDFTDLEFVNSLPQFAFADVRLSPHAGYIFDGASRADVVLWLQHDAAVAIELKLGTSRLTRHRFETEFLVPCRTSHNGTRIAGNMMAILDRRFGGLAPEEGLSVQINDQDVPLLRHWQLVVQPSVLNAWQGDGRPDFSPHTNCKSINTIVNVLGGPNEFNQLVREQIEFDYFENWIEAEN